MKETSYRRVLLKLSGEAFIGRNVLSDTNEKEFGIDHQASNWIAACIRDLHSKDIQIGIVVGGGNIFRGNQALDFGFSRTPADYIGMLGTMINGLILQQCLTTLGCVSHIMSALNTDSMIEKYNWQKALAYLKSGAIVIFVGGTGNPYFTTDTAAALRASEIEADALLKATKVNGIYDKDPFKFKDAKKIDQLTYREVLKNRLKIMDSAAIVLCYENGIPIHIFNLFEEGALLSVGYEKKGGSLIIGD